LSQLNATDPGFYKNTNFIKLEVYNLTMARVIIFETIPVQSETKNKLDDKYYDLKKKKKIKSYDDLINYLLKKFDINDFKDKIKDG